MRGSLFLKIFIGFWLVTLAIVGSWIVTDNYFQDQIRSEHPGPGREGPPPRFLLRLMYSLQSASDAELPDIVAEVEAAHAVTLYLIDREGRELTGRVVPEELREIAARLEGRRRRYFSHRQGRPVAVHEIYRRDRGVVRVVLQFAERRHRLLGLLIDNHWLRILLALLISGAICFGLSRLVTRRLSALQLAAGKIAAGDLDTRLEVRQRGGDETDALARDFNRMAEQLQQRMQAQKQLLSDVSHELRSPLSRMRVALALAMDAPDKRQDYLARMERETERLESMIQQLLSSELPTPELDTRVDLVALLSALCDDARFEHSGSDRAVAFHCNLEAAVIDSHGDLLRHSFDNILRNALRHTPDGSAVQVDLQREGDAYRVTIRDSGPGVPEGELERIFEAFHQVDRARTPGEVGFGLGLAIARRGIAIHGGTISARNVSPGLCVEVRLPIPG